MVERAIVALLRADGRPGYFLQGRAQPGRALARRGGLSFAGALMVAGTETCPGGEVGRGREGPHVRPCLGQDGLAARVATPGIVCSSAAASANGTMASWIRASSVAMWASSISIRDRCCWSRKA